MVSYDAQRTELLSPGFCTVQQTEGILLGYHAEGIGRAQETCAP